MDQANVVSKLTSPGKSFRTLFASVDLCLVRFDSPDPFRPHCSPELILDETKLVTLDVFRLPFDGNVNGDSQLWQDLSVGLPACQESGLRLGDHEGQAAEQLLGEFDGVKVGAATMEAAGKTWLRVETTLILVAAGIGDSSVVGFVHRAATADQSLVMASILATFQTLLMQTLEVELLFGGLEGHDVHLGDDGEPRKWLISC